MAFEIAKDVFMIAWTHFGIFHKWDKNIYPMDVRFLGIWNVKMLSEMSSECHFKCHMKWQQALVWRSEASSLRINKKCGKMLLWTKHRVVTYVLIILQKLALWMTMMRPTATTTDNSWLIHDNSFWQKAKWASKNVKIIV